MSKESCSKVCKILINQIFKLLPLREEGADWEKYLESILVSVRGLSRQDVSQNERFFLLICKLDGLFDLVRPEDFAVYRRVIFECLSLLKEIQNNELS
jgi:hypothetical protein|nr:MAG TPA: hypothetical protein [Caudoviricetes sp.]